MLIEVWMIIFSVAYGKKYIDMWIDRGIPSVLSPANKKILEREDTILFICTITDDVNYLRKKIHSSGLAKIFGNRIRIHHIPYVPSQNDHEEPQRRKKLSYALLMRALIFCFEQDQPFCFLVPDCIYSEDILEISWDLHQLTGKTVANFNGRVFPLPEDADIQKSILSHPNGVKRHFLDHMDPLWIDWSVTNPNDIAGENKGHQIIKRERSFHVFTSAPNPFMGRIQEQDLFFFAESGTFGVWDHQWVERLREQHRLLIQTNLDLCMTIEPWPSEEAMMVAVGEIMQKEKDRGERRSHFLGELFGREKENERARWEKYAMHGNVCCFSGRLP
jgi:hypothetical protein